LSAADRLADTSVGGNEVNRLGEVWIKI
jgi:hypothetical protein